MKKIYLHSNVCERRVAGYNKIYQLLLANSYIISRDQTAADIVLIFACGMKADDFQEIIKTENQKYIIFGCYTDMIPDRIKKENVGYVSLNDEERLYKLLEIINRDLGSWAFGGKDLYNYTYEEAMRHGDPRLVLPKCADVRTLHIAAGCAGECTYCTIRKATGKLVSESAAGVINKLEKALRAGYKHFRLQCENLGRYGEDIGSSLDELLYEINKIEHEFTIDLPDFDPVTLKKCLPIIRSMIEKKRISLIHIPLQSCSRRILALMKRKYDIKEVAEGLECLMRLPDRPLIGVDIIAGFPTETWEEYLASHTFIEKWPFNWIYVHGYSDKQGAESLAIFPKVAAAEIERRIKYTYDRVNNVVCYLNNYNKGY